MPENNKTPIKNKRKSRVNVSNKVTVDARNPIPFGNNSDVFSFIHQAAYLPFLPPKDCFAQDLLEARILSPTHNACVTTKRDYCVGTGFYDVKGREFSPGVVDWFKSMNRKNESVLKILEDMFEYKFTFGNCPIELVLFEVGGKRKMFIYVHNFLEWRLGKPDDDDIITYAVTSKLFVRQNYLTREMLKGARELPLYNPLNTDKQNWKKFSDGSRRTLIWHKNAVSGIPHYGLPSSVSGFIYQVLEYKGARFNLDNFENNMVVAAILALKGQLGDAEADKIAKKIRETHTGDGKHGRTIVINSEEGIDGSEYHQMDTKRDGSFSESDGKWSEKIILANQWDAILAGIISPSTLGKGSGFLTKIQELKLNTVIKPQQNKLINEVWMTIFKIAEDFLSLNFSDYEIAIQPNVDISGLTDVDITPAVTRNEVRKAKNLKEDPTDAGNEYMKSTGPQNTGKKEKEEEDVP